jgi:predicted nucleic acid-binding protein
MTASFVVDSSVALAWCFADEATPATDKLYDRMEDETASVPSWWFLEITNVLFISERKGRITRAKIGAFIALIDQFQLEIDTAGSDRAFTHILPLCRSYQLTSYDAVYLDLALRRGLPLATLDEPLRRAAKKAGVKLLGK